MCKCRKSLFRFWNLLRQGPLAFLLIYNLKGGLVERNQGGIFLDNTLQPPPKFNKLNFLLHFHLEKNGENFNFLPHFCLKVQLSSPPPPPHFIFFIQYVFHRNIYILLESAHQAHVSGVGWGGGEY